MFGRGHQLSDNDVTSVKSSSSSKYRDEEGERLLGMPAQRLNKTESVSLNATIEDMEYGENCSNEEEEIETRRRVVLDREGNFSYEDDDYRDLHARRMNSHCRRSLKRSMRLLLAIGVCAGIIATFSVLITHRLMAPSDPLTISEGHDQDIVGNDEWQEKLIEQPNSDRFDAIKAQLLKLRVTHPTAFDDIHSAQHAALKWLADHDPRQVDPNNEYLAQRYGLVTLWFSTTKTEYEWHLPAEYIESENQNNLRQLPTDDTSIWNRHENWLGDKSICQWEGVSCVDDKENIDEDYESDGYVTRIELSDNNMHGLICKELYTTLPRVTYADLSNNGFTGILSSEIAAWRNELTHLNFTSNRIGGSIPREIGEISQLKVLSFADNLLGGSIPHTLGDLMLLRDLDLSKNELKGTIPYELSKLDSLIFLNLGKLMRHCICLSMREKCSLNNDTLASNELKGDIPHEFSNLNLVRIDVSSNKLGGPIVTEIGLISHLEVLHLNENHLSGEVPTELGKLTHLIELDMSDNDFSGSLPSELSNLVGLGEFHVQI